jgi:hypothetical protein
LGGLAWQEVKREISKVLEEVGDVLVIAYEPGEEMNSVKTPSMAPGRTALIVLMKQYLDGLLDPFITLLEVHKLMYFLQEAGEPLRLNFKKEHCGPYAENLHHVLNAIDGCFISGYIDIDEPDNAIDIVSGAAEYAYALLDKHCGTKNRLARVNSLTAGFETPFGLELLSSVHWIITKDKACTFEDVIRQTCGWGEHNRQFTPRQIGIAVNRLSQQGWVGAIA